MVGEIGEFLPPKNRIDEWVDIYEAHLSFKLILNNYDLCENSN